MTAARPTIQPMSARRLSRTVLRIRLDMAVALLLVVVAQERSFQVRLAADQVDDRVPGRRFDQRVEPAVDGAAQDGAGDLQVLDAGQPAEVGLGYRCLEVDLDVAHRTLAEGLHPLDRDQVPVADDADPVGRVLHLGQHVRGHEDGLAGGPGLAYQLLELLLHERVQAAGRLVEDEQLRVVHERLYQADLLLVPLGQGADLPGGVQLEPLGQLGDPLLGYPAAGVAEEPKQLVDPVPAVEAQLAGQVPDPPPDRHPLAARVGAEHAYPATGGPDEVEHQPDRGGLAGAVGAEEAEDLPGVPPTEIYTHALHEALLSCT